MSEATGNPADSVGAGGTPAESVGVSPPAGPRPGSPGWTPGSGAGVPQQDAQRASGSTVTEEPGLLPPFPDPGPQGGAGRGEEAAGPLHPPHAYAPPAQPGPQQGQGFGQPVPPQSATPGNYGGQGFPGARGGSGNPAEDRDAGMSGAPGVPGTPGIPVPGIPNVPRDQGGPGHPGGGTPEDGRAARGGQGVPMAHGGGPIGQAGPAGQAVRKPRPAARPLPRTRKARLRVAKADPWSVMKVSFLLSIALGICSIVASAVLWMVLDSLGVFSVVGGTVREATSSSGQQGTGFDLQGLLSLSHVVTFTAIIAVIDVVLATALATLGAFLYNLTAGFAGGVELTLAEDE